MFINYREVIEMAKKIAFINFKGGVGKTTISVELASRLAYHYNKKFF
jgi:cellulose biosynthesis protein BcsQ